MNPPPPSVSVVIPTYNEIRRLPATIDEIVPFLEGHFPDYEVLIVDDDSPDGTSEYAAALGRSSARVRVLTQPRRLGKGAAIRRGCLAAEKELVLFMDADHATPIRELLVFVRLMREQPSDVIVGVRTYQEGESKWRRILGMAAQILAHLLVFERAVFDSQCGFKLFGRQAVRTIFPYCRVDGGMIDVEIFHLIHRSGLACAYQPVHWENKAGSRINILACMVRDTIELFRIRWRSSVGVYAQPVPPGAQPWA